MQKFKIKATMVTYLETEIEAESQEDAYEIALNMDGGQFTAIENAGDWRIDDVTEIDD